MQVKKTRPETLFSPDDPFEQLLQDFFTQERQEEEPPLHQLLARTRQDYPTPAASLEHSPQTPEPAPSTHPTAPSSHSGPPSSSDTPGWLAQLWHIFSPRGLALGLTAAVALLVLVTYRPGTSTRSASLEGPPHRIPHQRDLVQRGSSKPRLLVFVQRQHNTRLATSGERFFRGDRLQLATQSAKPTFVYILHRGAKQWTALYPQHSSQVSIAIPAAKQHALSGSLEVTDPARGNEEIWACFSHKALPYALVKDSFATLLASRQNQRRSRHGTKPPPKTPCLAIQRFRLTRLKERRR